MATSKVTLRATAAVAAVSGLLAIGLLAAGARPARTHATARASNRAAAPGAAVAAWPRPARPPAGWSRVTTLSTDATLFYPRGWSAVAGDHGTVTRTLRNSAGQYLGYLNVTPRQGAEPLHGWAAFRTRHNADEGDTQVRTIAASSAVRFRWAHGSCVVDDYLSRVGANPYRELACLVIGDRHADVFVGATAQASWSTLGPIIQRSAAAFLQR